jgi:hypothetical protein
MVTISYTDTMGQKHSRIFNDAIEARVFVIRLKNVDKTTIRLIK